MGIDAGLVDVTGVAARQRQVEVQVPSVTVGVLVAEELTGVLADRLEQPISRSSSGELDGDEGRANEFVKHLDRRRVFAVDTDGGERRLIAATGEHTHCPQRTLRCR